MSAWRTALRIAAREARRAKGRSLLVLAMIALPVLALSFAAVNFDMFRLTPQEQINREIGAAEARLRFTGEIVTEQDFRGEGWAGTRPDDAEDVADPTAAEVLALLPEGSRAIPVRRGALELRTATGIGGLDVRGLDIADPMTRGMVELLDGAPPREATEVALTRPAAKRLGVDIGGTVATADGAHRYTVVGIVEFPAELREVVVLPPHALPGADPDRTHIWLVETPQPVDWAQVRALNTKGAVVTSRAVWLDPPPVREFSHGGGRGNAAFGTTGLIVGLALLEVVLLAGPAFAVGARRRRRDLALIAANGGTAAHLRRVVLADGVVLGLAGAAVGIVGGVALAVLALPAVETYLTHSRAGGYRFFPLALAGIAGLAVVTGLLAALVPAFTAARADVIASLTGRRGQVRASRRWLIVGLAGVVVGMGIVGYGAWHISSDTILTGLIIGELGLVLCTPALVGLIARLGRILPLAPRIALRDIARNRAAAVPAISAVMAAVAGSVAIGVYFTASEARRTADYRPSLPHGYVGVSYELWGPHGRVDPAPPDRVAAAVAEALPDARIVQLQRPGCAEPTEPDVSCHLYPELPKERECPYWGREQLSRAEQQAAAANKWCATNGYYYGSPLGDVIADGDTVALLTGAHGSDLDRAAEVLAAGGVVVGSDRYLVDGKITLIVEDGTGRDPESQPRITVPGHALTTGIRPAHSLISAGAVAAAKLTVQPGGLVAAPAGRPSQADEDRLSAALAEIGQLSWAVERGPYRNEDPFLLVLGIAAGMITLGAAAIATGLASADGRADLSTLAAVGASPRLRRLLSLSQSGMIAGLGSTLGIAAGLGAAFAVLFAFNQAAVDAWPAESPYPISVPWQSLLIVAVVPLVAILGAGLLTRSRLPIERRLA